MRLKGPSTERRLRFAKITPPDPLGAIPRKRLFRIIDRCRKKPVVWITGPAGSGKTTLVSSYLQQRKLPCLWYQVDDGDGDLASFFYYMGLAAGKAAPRYRRPMPLLTPEYLQGIPTFTRRYFEELYGRLCRQRTTSNGSNGFVIILDNFHEASSPDFQGMIGHAMENIPSGINVIVLSRGELPAQLARLRAGNRVSFMGWNDLSFTLTECRAFLKRRCGRPLPDETVRQLHDGTDGWAAGLLLMTEGDKTGEIHCSLISELSRQAVFNYFASEIFEKTDEETRDFLLKTSFFSSLTAAAAMELTGNAGARSILSHLSRNHYFTDWRPQDEPVYQYHPLFRDFLQSRAKGDFTRKELNEIWRLTAVILENNGRIEDAASLLVDAGEWKGLTELVSRHAQSLVSRGRHRILEEWLRRLPTDILGENSWSLYWLGICRMALDPYESRGLLERSFHLFRTESDAAGLFLSWASIVDSFVYAWGDFSPLDRWIAVMEDILSEQKEFPSAEIEDRIAGCMLCAMANRQPGRDDLPRWAERVQGIVAMTDNIQIQMTLGSQLLFYCLWVGDFSRITLVVDAMSPSGGIKDHDPLTKQQWYAWKAMYSWFVADWSACRQAISDGMINAEHSGIHLLDLFLLAQGVIGGLSLGDPEAAAESLEKMALTRSPRPGDKALYHYQAASLRWYQGEYRKSAEHGKLAVEITREIGWPVPTVLCLIEQSVTLFDGGRRDEADDCLSEALDICRGMNGLEFHACISGARFALDRGNEEQLVHFLRRGMTLGARYGYMNMPRWNDWHISRLCAKALEQGIETEYVQKLIAFRGLVPPISQPHGRREHHVMVLENWPYPVKIYTFGNFRLLREVESVEFGGNGQQKPLTMLKVLIALGGRDVPASRLSDILWPDAEGDSAHKSFEITLLRLRRLLGKEGAVQLKAGTLNLDPRSCWVDLWAFEDIIGRTRGSGRWSTAVTGNASPETISLSEKAIAMYKGHFLESDAQQPWTSQIRESTRSSLLRLVASLGRYYESIARWEKASECYQKGIETDNLAEEFYRRLMVCLDRLGRKAEAVRVYHECSSALSSALGITPSEKTTAMYTKIRGR